jgi:hypothetical protein
VLLGRSDQLGQHPGERVDLVAAQLGSRGEARRLLGEDALEPEHEGEADFPLQRRRLVARFHLGERRVERVPERRAGRQHDRSVLVGPQEGLARPGFRPKGRGFDAVRILRRCRSKGECLVHACGTKSVPPLQVDPRKPSGTSRTTTIADRPLFVTSEASLN